MSSSWRITLLILRESQWKSRSLPTAILNRFLVVAFGWPDEDELECFTIFHFEIKNGKVWIQQNWTEIPVADELIERGVRREDIVLGFVPDYARADTGFAAA